MGKMIVQDSHGKQTLFDGQWNCDKFEGRGKICYSNGDVYRGTVKDSKPHGHGMMKQGRFMGETTNDLGSSGWKGFKLKHRRKDPLQAGSSFKGIIHPLLFRAREYLALKKHLSYNFTVYCLFKSALLVNSD